MADSKAPAAAAPAKDAGVKGKEAPAAVKGKDAPAGAKPDAAAGKGAPLARAKKNLKPVLLAAAAAVVLLGAGAAAWFLFFNDSGKGAASTPAADAGKAKPGEKVASRDAGKDSAKDAAKDKKGEAKRPFFVEFEPFTVNLKDPEKFLQIKLTFQVHSDTAAESLKDLAPIVRSAVIPVLSSQDPAEIMTNEGKEKMSSEVVVAANHALGNGEMENAIDAALIVHMIVQ